MTSARVHFFLASGLSIIWLGCAPVRATPIDDSGTRAFEPSIDLRWKTSTPTRSPADNVLVGVTTLRVRLNVAPWLHHAGRIYLSLPASAPGQLSADWPAHGQFLGGRVVAGGRALLYSGRILEPVLEEELQLQLTVRPNVIQRASTLNISFDMEDER